MEGRRDVKHGGSAAVPFVDIMHVRRRKHDDGGGFGPPAIAVIGGYAPVMSPFMMGVPIPVASS